MDPQAYDAMLKGFESNYGHAGSRVIKEFHKRGWHTDASELRKRFDDALTGLAAGMPSAQRRAGSVFAMMLVMGELLRETGIIPLECDVKGCVDWGWRRIQTSEEFRRLAVETNSVERLLEWAETSGDVFDIVADIPPGRTPLAYRCRQDHILYLPEKSLPLIPGLGSTPQAAVNGLKKTGRLLKCGDDHWYWKQIPGGPKVKHLRVTGVFVPDEEIEEGGLAKATKRAHGL